MEVNVCYLREFRGVEKYKSVNRAIRRGLVSKEGIVYPKRPYNNRKNSCKRKGKFSNEPNMYKRSNLSALRMTLAKITKLMNKNK